MEKGIITKELEDTLQIIFERTGMQKSVFITKRDFPWFNHCDGQLRKLHEIGMITKPIF